MFRHSNQAYLYERKTKGPTRAQPEVTINEPIKVVAFPQEQEEFRTASSPVRGLGSFLRFDVEQILILGLLLILFFEEERDEILILMLFYLLLE